MHERAMAGADLLRVTSHGASHLFRIPSHGVLSGSPDQPALLPRLLLPYGFPLNPIPDVVYCIQLLKVASQIEYQELMDICVNYLSAAPWSLHEENQIREFYSLGTLSSDSATDLGARLRFTLTEPERKKESEILVQRILKSYLRIALTKDSSLEVFDSRSARRAVFAEAVHALVETTCTPMCREALQYALAIATTELENILESKMGPGCQKGWGTPVATVNLLQFCWLFEVLREANAGQVVVELLLKHDVSKAKQHEDLAKEARMTQLLFQRNEWWGRFLRRFGGGFKLFLRFKHNLEFILIGGSELH